MFERITCKHCINYRNPKCPRREYKDPKLNDIAVGPDDTPCEKIRSKIKRKTAFGSYTLERTKNRVYLIDKDGGVMDGFGHSGHEYGIRANQRHGIQ